MQWAPILSILLLYYWGGGEGRGGGVLVAQWATDVTAELSYGMDQGPIPVMVLLAFFSLHPPATTNREEWRRPTTATKRIEHCMIEHLTLTITLNNVVCSLFVCLLIVYLWLLAPWKVANELSGCPSLNKINPIQYHMYVHVRTCTTSISTKTYVRVYEFGL